MRWHVEVGLQLFIGDEGSDCVVNPTDKTGAQRIEIGVEFEFEFELS